MKRNAQLTIRLRNSLVKQGFSVTTRGLERWSHDGLGPLGTPGFAALVAHYSKVAALSTSGRDADIVARRLGSQGFSCQRLRPALLRELGIASEPPSQPLPMPDLSSGPSGDAGFAAVESIARAIAADARGMPPLMVRVFRALMRNAEKRADETGESAEAVFHSFLVNGLAHLLGADYYNGAALEAVLGLPSGIVSAEVLDVINTHLRVSVESLDDCYRTTPVGDIVLMAKRLTDWAPLLLRQLRITRFTRAEIEEVAAVLAPAALHLVNLLQSAFDDFPKDLLLETSAVPELPPAASG